MTPPHTDPFQVFTSFARQAGSPSHGGPRNLRSPRLEALRELLSPLEFDEHLFHDGTRVNFTLKLPGWTDGRPATVLLAHHDTVLANCHALDNSGSVSVLVALAHRLNGSATRTNVLFVWDDAEEVGGLGARELATQLNGGVWGEVAECLNLEMIGSGTGLFVDGNAPVAGQPDLTRVTCPYCDGSVLRAAGLPCSTLGTLSQQELVDVVARGFCPTWTKIHSAADTVDLVEAASLEQVMAFLEGYLTR